MIMTTQGQQLAAFKKLLGVGGGAALPPLAGASSGQVLEYTGGSLEFAAGGSSGNVSVTDAGNGNVVVNPSPGTGTFTLDVVQIVKPTGNIDIAATTGGVAVSAPAGIAGIAGGVTAEIIGPNSGLSLGTNSLFIGLPTSDPHVVNALWNNGGAVTVSAG